MDKNDNYIILKKISCPEDIKKLNFDELKLLAFEIRKFLISSVLRTGGHLASNLGVVELTIAVHFVFNAGIDKIIWDVGHQSYVHKILTGRRDKFDSLRTFGGISGFPKTSESELDCFNTGHSSTSISAALGFASAMKISDIKAHAVPIIGDGAMTGGMAFEALNNAGVSKTPIIVVLNDNGMSISNNVGAISRQLNKIRNNPVYFKIKDEVRTMLDKIPVFGEKIRNVIHKVKNQAKSMVVPNRIFEDFGFDYIGPVDGHDISSLIAAFEHSQKSDEPALVHVHTKKGKGYEPSEDNPDIFHNVTKIDSDNSKFENSKDNILNYQTKCDNAKEASTLIIETLSDETYSEVFGNKICSLAAKNEKIIAITASMTHGTGLEKFEKEFPKRFFDVGIAEQHAVTFACGFAKMDFVPVVAIYSSFLQRAYDQIIHDVAMQNLHVILMIDRAGIVGEDGETHQGIYDIAYLSHIPNIKILAPSTKLELENMLDFAINKQNSPIAIRYPRGRSHVLKNIENVNYNFKIEPSVIRRTSDEVDVVIISVGNMLYYGIKVQNFLKNFGYHSVLIDAKVIKPINNEFYKKHISGSKLVVTLEDGVIIGGFGSLLECELEVLIKKFGFPSVPIEHGSVNQLKEKYVMNSEKISLKILSILKKCDKNFKLK